MRTPLAALALAALCAGTAGSRASAQEATAPAPVAPREQPVVNISPRGAFLRALALPGWGHAAIGSQTRGGFYFAVESATAYTLIRSRLRLNDVRRRALFREGFLRAGLEAEGVTEPAEIDARLDDDDTLAELRTLEESRAAQQEDMVALGIFVLLLSGADAYVSAHLSRFPQPLELEARPLGGGRVELALRVPLRE